MRAPTIAEASAAIAAYFRDRGIPNDPPKAVERKVDAPSAAQAAPHPFADRVALYFDPVRGLGTVVYQGRALVDVTDFRATKAGVTVTTRTGTTKFFGDGSDPAGGLPATPGERALSRADLAKAAADVADYMAADTV